MKVLLIEDNPDHSELIEDTLNEAFTAAAVAIHTAETLEQGLDQLQHSRFDICLCDLSLPDSSIDETVARLQAFESPTPLVVLTSLDDVDVARTLVHQGIQDYLAKDDLNAKLLYRICTYAIERQQHQTALEQHNQDMQAFCRSLSHDLD